MNGEFEFSEQDFQRVRRIIGDIAGIYLEDGKRELVYSRLSRCLRQRGLQRFEDYCNLLETHEDTDETVSYTHLDVYKRQA